MDIIFMFIFNYADNITDMILSTPKVQKIPTAIKICA